MPPNRSQIRDVLKSIYPFRKMEDGLIDFAVGQVGILEVKAGTNIYKPGQASERLFIVFNGQITLSFIRGKKKKDVCDLHGGDIFGFEMIDRGIRQATAKAASDSILLTINRSQLKRMSVKIKNLLQTLIMLSNSYQLSLKTNLVWREVGEAVYYISHRHRIFLFFKSLAPLTLGMAGTLLGLYFISGAGANSGLYYLLIPYWLCIVLWMILAYVDWNNDYSIITSRRVLFQEKIILLYDSRQESPLDAIMSVTTETNQLGRILGYGNVVIRTYAGQIELPDVVAPTEVANLLQAHQYRSTSEIGRLERLDQYSESLRRRLANDSEGEQDQSIKTIRTESILPNFVNNLFQIRFEHAGTITYRTHWFILVKRIWLPTTFLILLQLTLLARLMGWFELFTAGGLSAIILGFDLFVVIWWLYSYVDWRNDYYVITDDQLLDVYKKPLGREERRAAPLQNIQSINFQRKGWAGVILNFGTVFIKIGENTLTFDEVFNPSEVQREIFKRFSEYGFKEKQAQKDAEEQRMLDWIQAYDRIRSIDQSKGDTSLLIPPDKDLNSG